MRDPQRIDRILLGLREKWMKDPDLRFGQLLFNLRYLVFPKGEEGEFLIDDPYNYEDTRLESILYPPTDDEEPIKEKTETDRIEGETPLF